MIISVQNLSHRYGERVALDGLTFDVEKSAAYGILGPNGCGKSTLFRILATLQRPAGGDATIDGVPVSGKGIEVRRILGVVFQSSTLDARLTVAENLAIHAQLYGISGRTLRRAVDEALEFVRMESRRDDVAGRLSGGQKRRVEIARALMHRPSVLLMDEASSGLDPAARHEMWEALHELRASRGVTILFTTHLMDEAENATRLLLMNRGRAIAEGSPEEIKRAVGGDVVIFEPAQPGLPGALDQTFGVTAAEVNGEVHVEVSRGHQFIAEAVEALPGMIRSASLRKPTLEDAFLKLSGSLLNGGPDA